MPRTHLALKNFRPPVLEATTALFNAKPWNANVTDQLGLGQTFVSAICQAYNVRDCTLVMRPLWGASHDYTPAVVSENTVGETVVVSAPTIVLDAWSITNLMVALRMHLLANGVAQVNHDPEAWVHSLFYTVRPAMFRARVREGRIGHLTAKDTFTTETWELLVNADVGSDRTEMLNCRPNEVAGILERIRNETDDYVEGDGDDLVTLNAGDMAVIDAGIAAINDNLPDEEETDVDDSITDNLGGLNRDALRRLAAEHNISGRGSMLAPQLREALRNAGVHS